MALEIEHKYLVKNDSFKASAKESFRISQGYLCKDPKRVVRVRIKGDNGFLTIKGENRGAVRQEFEYQIPIKDAQALLAMCLPPVIEKIRYIISYDGHIWEIDEFLGDREGLITAEIELKTAEESYMIPEFIGENVTENPAYYNSNL